MEIHEFLEWLAAVALLLAGVEVANFEELARLTMAARVEFVCLSVELVAAHRLLVHEKAAAVVEAVEPDHLDLRLPVAVAAVPMCAELVRPEKLSAVVPVLLCAELVQPETLHDLVLAADVVAIVDVLLVKLDRLLARASVPAFVVPPGVVAALVDERLEWLHMLPN